MRNKDASRSHSQSTTSVTDFGRSLGPILDDPEAAGHPAFAYRSNVNTVRTDRYRLIAHKNGHLELYDHRSSEGETKNLATAQPELAKELLGKIEARLQK